MVQLVLYVDPQRGQDDRAGRLPSQPLKTLSQAVQLSRGDTLIRLAKGVYSDLSGEQFPIAIPAGCEVRGDLSGDRPGATLQGGGQIQHPLLGLQSVTCQLLDTAILNTVNVTNPQRQGIGLWLATGRPQLQKVVVRRCEQHGAVALGRVLPTLQDCWFEGCGQAGIVFFSQSKGQLEQIVALQNRVGIWLRDSAAPLIRQSRLEQCDIGIAIADTANPVLRENRIRANQTYGIYLTELGTADLGQPHDLGHNVIRQNGQLDLHNTTQRSLGCCGNDILPQQLRGPIELLVSELPDPSAVPPTLLNQLPDFPNGESQDPTTPLPVPLPPLGSVRFTDMANHWAGPFVDGLAAAQLVAGLPDGTFRPNQGVNRAEFAALIVASFPNRPQRRSPRPFADVESDFWAYPALRQAYVTGFLSGFPDGTLRPDGLITRTQAIVAVTNGLGFSGGRADDLGVYRDRAQIPSYAVDALASATRQRLVVNYPDPAKLRPVESMSRGELAALVYQGRVTLGWAEQVSSPYIVQPATSTVFSDLSGHWANSFVQGLTSLNLISGFRDGRFAPDDSMTRAQFASLLANAFAPRPLNPAITFVDVPPDFWANDAIQTVYRGGFMAGFPDQTFSPNHPLLRVQTWVAMVNGLYGLAPVPNLADLENLPDSYTLPTYALRQTAIALSKGLITTKPRERYLRPNQVATRAETCVAVYQALVDQQRLPAIASDSILRLN